VSIFGTERNGSPLTVICPAGAQKCSRRRKACLGWVAAGMLALTAPLAGRAAPGRNWQGYT